MKKCVLILWIISVCCGRLFSQSSFSLDSGHARLAPGLLTEKMVSKILVEAADSSAFISWTAFFSPKLKIKPQGRKLYLISGFTEGEFEALKKAPGIKFIDRADRSAKEEIVSDNFDRGLNGVTSIHALFPTLAGSGLTVSIKEKPFDLNDIDLKGRILLTNQFDEPFTVHATYMATIIAGAGNSSSIAMGPAWAATVSTSDFSQLLPDKGSDLTTLGVSVQNHSYGVGVENYYGIESSEYDYECILFPQILHVFSSGNDGDQPGVGGVYAGVEGFANLTGQFKVSKNTISVGSTDRFGNIVPRSSRGPAYDGRVKPELMAFGDSGSSEAAAVVSGISLLVQQSYKNIYGELPDAALVKAVLINSARDVGRDQVDFETGFGNVNAVGAVRAVEGGKFYSASVLQDEEIVFPITIPANQNLLKVTLVWNDPQAEPFSLKALVNDLNLSVRNVISGEVFDPWVLNPAPTIAALQEVAHREADHLNNVEQVTISVPAEGDYELMIKGYDITQGAQSFFVTHETVNGFEWLYPLEKNTLLSNSVNIIRWRWDEPPAQGTLEYRFTSESNWRMINFNVELAGDYYEWTPPDTTGLIQLRISSGSEVFESVVFSISNPQRLKVGFNCDSEVMFIWNKDDGATDYTLFQLGEKYMEPILTTVDTFAIFEKNGITSNYFTVAPIVNGTEGARELTIDYNLQGTGCYFITFLARQYVITDEANFDIVLGTSYNLLNATLERFQDGSFKSVSTIASLAKKFSMQDSAPLPGIVSYRVKLLTDDQQVIYSPEEQVFYVREKDLYVYPNPIFNGQVLNIVISDEDFARIELIDMNGVTISKTEDFGEIKTIDTTQIESGLYGLRVQRQDGTFSVKRLIVIK